MRPKRVNLVAAITVAATVLLLCPGMPTSLAVDFETAAVRAVDPRPNIVFVLVDDMGYGDLGCMGATDIKTPNIDRLASEGVKFTDFYANAQVC